MLKARLSLFLGIFFISMFPILIKMGETSPLISAFYRMLIATVLLLPYSIFARKMRVNSFKEIFPALLCGIIFATDISVWNIAIKQSTALQATLLTNLSPVWVGIISLIFLKTKPLITFWIGTLVAILGLIVLIGIDIFVNLSFDTAFVLAMLSGFLYAIYILLSKDVLQKVAVLTFVTYSTLTSTLYLFILSLLFGESFSGFSNISWTMLVLQGIFCQLVAWMLISYAIKRMRATRVSLSLLSQAVITGILAALFLGESVNPQMALGGFIILFGIGITFLPVKDKHRIKY